MNRGKIITIPNILSGFRILLALAYLVICLRYGRNESRALLTGILLLSALTDWLDGRIARKFNMISELGKILDPFADKLTQGILLICLLGEYRMARYVFLLFLMKESFMGIVGLKTIKSTGKNNGAMWYGKVSTAFFYVVMIILILFPGISGSIAEGLLTACGAFMLLALVLYARYYCVLLRANTAV